MARRSRTFATLVYTDELTREQIVEQIEESLKVPCYLIFHDKDDGKEHGHLLIFLEAQKNADTFKNELKEKLPFSHGLEVVSSRVGYLYYLCHIGNDSKHRYSEDEVYSLCGAKEYKEIISEVTPNSNETITAIVDFIENEGVLTLSELLRHCIYSSDKISWLHYLENHYGLINTYITSRNYERDLLRRIAEE